MKGGMCMKKIMFNDKYGLTQAVLEGRNTQTRRIVTEQQLRTILHFPKYAERNFDELLEGCKSNEYGVHLFAPYVKGEEVAIAQKYSELEYGIDWVRRSINKEHAGWNNKLFVSAEEMPHRIRITNVRVERLQDISEEDCMKEGIERCEAPTCHKNYCIRDCADCAPSLREAFAALIDKVSGKGTWNSNPYVFVYDFELIK